MNPHPNRTLIGLFFVAGIALLIAFLLALGGGWFTGNRPHAIAYFNQNVSGLDTGSPVRLRGVAIGKVSAILLSAGRQVGQERAVPVMIEFDPALARRLGAGETLGTPEGVVTAIKGGLCAKLKLQSFVTGVLYVDLDYAESGPAEVRISEGVPEIPSVLSDHVAITQAFSRMIDNLSGVDYKGISDRLGTLIASLNRLTDDPALAQAGKDLSSAMAAFSRLSEKLSSRVDPLADDLQATSAEARRTLAKLATAADQLNDLTRRDGATRAQVDQAVADFSQAAQAVKSLADYLDRNPEALLKGKRRQETGGTK